MQALNDGSARMGTVKVALLGRYSLQVQARYAAKAMELQGYNFHTITHVGLPHSTLHEQPIMTHQTR